jgi:hypothetical protein
MGVVDHRENPSANFAAARGEKRLGLRVVVERMPCEADELLLVLP